MNPAHFICPAVFMLVVVASGVWHGEKTARWKDHAPLDQYVARMKTVPVSFGDWTSEVNVTGDDLLRGNLEIKNDPVTGQPELRSLDNWQAHGIQDYFIRDYRNKRTTESYRVMLFVGRPGPIASHSPEVCYRGSGHVQVGESAKWDCIVDDPASPAYSRRFVLNLLKFRPPATRLDGREHQIRWGFLPPDGGVETPGTPRITYASKPALYKLYVSHDMLLLSGDKPRNAGDLTPAAPATKQADPSNFLKAFLPILEASLKDPPQSKQP